MTRAIFTFLALLSITVTGYGQITKVKGKGELTYSGMFGQSTGEARAAITEAKKNALTRYAATFDSARFELYKKIEPMLFANIDQYISDYTQLDQQTDKSSKHYTVIIEASINPAQIETAIQASAGPAASQPSTETSYLTFVFVARELGARKVYDDKRTVVAISNEANSGTEKNAVAEDGQSAVRAVDKNSTTENTTGGSTETKADALTYRVTTVTDVDNAVNSVLTKARYETVDPVDAGLDVDAFKSDFSLGSDISPTTRRAAIKALKEKEIRYLAIANMDVGLPQKDDVSGMIRVYVTVTAKVTDLAPKFPKTVASIAGKPYAGLGPDPQVAKQNALNEAAINSAAELVDQLRMKNVR
jgi:hypothetical protein